MLEIKMARQSSMTLNLCGITEVLHRTHYFEIIIARKTKNANIDVRQMAKVFNEQTFADGVFNDDYFFVQNMTTETIKYKRYDEQF